MLPESLQRLHPLHGQLTQTALGTRWWGFDDRRRQRVTITCFDASLWPEGPDRLLRRVARLDGLDHPTIPRMLDVGRGPDGNAPYMVSELVEGTPLIDAVPMGPVPATELVLQLGQAFQALEAHGLAPSALDPRDLVLDRGTGSVRFTTPPLTDHGWKPVGGRRPQDPWLVVAVLGMLLTGDSPQDLDPRVLERFGPTVSRALHPDPRRRPGLAEVMEALREDATVMVSREDLDLDPKPAPAKRGSPSALADRFVQCVVSLTALAGLMGVGTLFRML